MMKSSRVNRNGATSVTGACRQRSIPSSLIDKASAMYPLLRVQLLIQLPVRTNSLHILCLSLV